MGDDNSHRTIPVDEDSTMRITDAYLHNGSIEEVVSEYEDEISELFNVIEQIPADKIFVKDSNESRYSDIFLASPVTMNHMILIEGLYERGWSVDHANARGKEYIEKVGLEPKSVSDSICAVDIAPGERWGKRSVDGYQNGIAVEIQFGKYAFMMYDVLAKFGHFTQQQRMDLGIELVPSNKLYQNMSSGPGYFEQLTAELEHLPDGYVNEESQVPALILGVGFERAGIDFGDLVCEVKGDKNILDY